MSFQDSKGVLQYHFVLEPEVRTMHALYSVHGDAIS